MSNVFVVPWQNTGGGLALFWPMDKNVNIQSFSNRHIDAIIDHGVDNAQRFTGFYRDPDTISLENSWCPQVCLGDFNEILLAKEKQGWLDRSER